MRWVWVLVEESEGFTQVDGGKREGEEGGAAPAAAIVADQDVGNGRCVFIEIERFC